VGGDTLDLQITAAAGTHGLITTPGATRFYRSGGEPAIQRTQIHLATQARLEWLPLETICHNECLAENRLTLSLAPDAEFMGLDITALGLPHAQLPFQLGRFQQHIEVPGIWLERGRIDATDLTLMQGRGGLQGMACLGTLFFVAGSALNRTRRQTALELARTLIDAHPLRLTAGATSANEQVLVVRALAPLVESSSDLLRKIWHCWRQYFWQLSSAPPRIWST
jgi:urease accessory protein